MAKSSTHDAFTAGRELRTLRQAMRDYYRRWFMDDLSSVSQSMALEETRLPRLLKLSIITLSSATGLFLVWAAITPVKELARTEGQVLPSGYSQLVQHLEGGLVKAILVHEGDFVQKEQLLVQLDGAGLLEDFREQQALVEALSLQAELLHALIDNRVPDFSAIRTSEKAIAQQQHMYETMRDSRRSEALVIDAQIAQKSTIITRLGQALETARSNLAVSHESRQIYTNLAKQGLVARTTALRKQEELNSKLGDVNSLTQQLEESKRELGEFQQRRESLTGQQRDSAYNDLHKVESDLAQARENLKKRSDRVERLDVRAPVMGYVKGLRINTIGSVIPAGQTLMEIVPVDEKLIVEARILPQQVGRVNVGQTVQVKVDSYDYVRYGAIPGTLESISAMTFTDEIRRQDYYKGRVRLARSYAGQQPGVHPVMPGMTVDADIVTGEKTVLGYLLKPIQVAVHNALSEQ